MANAAEIKERIRQIAQGRNNVSVEEIEWVVNQLGSFYDIHARDTKSGHGRIFRIGPKVFGVCKHHRGSKQVKRCYIDGFIDAMTELGWFEE